MSYKMTYIMLHPASLLYKFASFLVMFDKLIDVMFLPATQSCAYYTQPSLTSSWSRVHVRLP